MHLQVRNVKSELLSCVSSYELEAFVGGEQYVTEA